MSEIKFLHSGGNGVIISAPSSNPAADRTLTLPGDADGTILTSNSATGKLLQVQSVTKSDTFSLSTLDTWTDITGLSVSITPSNASNKILILATVSVSASNGAHYMLRMEKNGSLIAGGDAAGNRIRGFAGGYDASGAYSVHSNSCNFLDTKSKDIPVVLLKACKPCASLST